MLEAMGYRDPDHDEEEGASDVAPAQVGGCEPPRRPT
jgi:hypothetical protein